MLFNSPEFLFVFLPATLLAFALFGRSRAGGMAVLLIASAVFYGRWSVPYLVMLLALLSINFVAGQSLLKTPSRLLLAAGVVLNLGVLGYFKYYGFFAEQLALATGLSIKSTGVALPLGISFFIFQKIAYLVDCHRRQAPPHSYFSFSLFVLFFPQLIAGPITHAREIVPQFANLPRRLAAKNLAVGMTIFVIGLCKKMLLADNIGTLVGQVFDHAAATPPSLFVAWLGAAGFGLQIYFDFSGYSDMAIGLAFMFGLRLPENFASPYKARSITEFWRRWHITLSRFLRDYLYIPLGGNRRGAVRQYVNLIVTMALGGLWHGAGWTFVLWGVLHGLCLALHKLWREFTALRLPGPLAWALTLIVVILLWVPFRAPSIDATLAIWQGMFGLNGVAVPSTLAQIVGRDVVARFVAVQDLALDPFAMAIFIPVGLAVVLFAPNTQTLLRDYQPVLIERRAPPEESAPPSPEPPRWRPATLSACLIGIALAACILKFNDIAQFIYFQF